MPRQHHTATYKPAFELLENRVVPAGLRNFPTISPPPPAATQFEVSAPAHVEAGQAFDVVIRAKDAQNKLVPGFKGTVTISLAKADAGAVFPTTFTFSAADKGRHVIHVAMQTPRPQKLIATSGKISGRANFIVDNPVTHFGVYTYTQAIAGWTTTVNVLALDANNNVVQGYTGTIHFGSSDAFANLPANYKFSAADGGSHTFLFNFASAGIQSLGVADVQREFLFGGAATQVYPSWWAWYNPMYAYSPYYLGTWGSWW